jgi:amino acid transporter
MALAVSIAAAAIAQGAAEYIAILVNMPTALITATLIAVFTAIAVLGVRESVGFAIAMGLVEIAGLLAATLVGFASAKDLNIVRLLPADGYAWIGVAAGANIAFFAFIGFETLANMAEETVDAARTIPRAILGSLAASTMLYVAVSTAIVLSGVKAANPMLALFEGRAATVFAGLGSLAVANGALIEIVMLARIFYGMARKEQLPAMLAIVDERSQTPVRATLLAGAIVMVTALFLPFAHLLVAANALTLGVFALVALALWRIKSKDNSVAPFSVPQWLPPVATVLSVLLILADLLT